MKTSLNLFAAISVLLLAGCSSTAIIQKRISRNPELFEQLSQAHQELVQEGRITEGMNRNAVFLAWGSADHISHGSKNGKPTETWTYGGGYGGYGAPRFNVGFGYGSYGRGGYYGYGMGFPIGVDPYYETEADARVVFTSGKVTEWQAAIR